MTYIIVGVAFVCGILAVIWLLGTTKGLQLVHRQTVRTVRRLITASREATPHEPLESIYRSIALHRGKAISTLREEPYMELLEKAECFRSNPAMSAEEFTEALAHVEDLIKLKKAGVIRKYP